MSYGNHDYHANDLGIYPKNVYVFPEQVTNKIINIDNKTIGICGFSYTNKWISEKKINEYPIKKRISIIKLELFMESRVTNLIMPVL